MKLISNFPKFRQFIKYSCGACVVQEILAYYGVDISEHEAAQSAGTTRRGTTIKGIRRALKEFKFKFKDGSMNIAALKKCVDEKKPVIISLQAWYKTKDWKNAWSHGHYAVVIGYDSKRVYFEDPICIVRSYLTFKELEERWHSEDVDRKRLRNWGLVVYGKKPVYSINKAVHMDFSSFDAKKAAYSKYLLLK